MDFEEVVGKIQNLCQIYENELNQNKRCVETIDFCKKSIGCFEKLLQGRSQDPLMAMLTFSAGYREVPAEGTPRGEYIKEAIDRFQILLRKAETMHEAQPCKHIWIPKTWFRGGLSPPSLDVQCSKCDSFVTMYNSGLIILGEHVTGELKEAFDVMINDKDLMASKGYKFFISACESLNLPHTNEVWNLAYEVEKT